ncbi:MAG: filamentous hemagglutinin N-terminal domain-containing protein [Cyanobacteria bacterium P01_H01_bin.26]
MTPKFFYLLLATVPLWLLGLQEGASAQLSTGVEALAIPLLEPSGAVQTNIQSATSDTTVVHQADQFDVLGGQLSDGLTPNLIHQFQQFDLGTDDTANFVVDPNVANVINLIDGLHPSVIDGLLTLTSSDPDFASQANLFLVNPAGIVFGENVRLDIPANLTATSASGLLFEDTYLLSIDGAVSEIALPDSKPAAPGTQAVPSVENLGGDPTGYLLLSDSASSSVSDPLSTALPVGTIENQGILEVVPQASITLIGHYVQNDGNLVAPGGTANLAATSGEKLLRLSQPGTLLTLDVLPADALTVLSPAAETSSVTALPATELAQMLTGGDEQSATQIDTHSDGTQTLTGTPPLTPSPGSVLVRGIIDVSDSTPMEEAGTPGHVSILGDQINLVGGSIYANGISQAGTLSIGGMPAADGFGAAYILVDRNSELSATASDGNGGSIYIWADDTVRFYGDAVVTGESPDSEGTISIDAGNVVDIR